MGRFVRAFTRRNIIAVTVGVLLVGAPLVAFDFWLGGLIYRQGQEEVETSANSTTIVETLVDLARNMRMDAVAEGVETFEQVTHLRELGIRSAQGYVFAPPLPAGSLLQLIDAIDPLPVPSVALATTGPTNRASAA